MVLRYYGATVLRHYGATILLYYAPTPLRCNAAIKRSLIEHSPSSINFRSTVAPLLRECATYGRATAATKCKAKVCAQ
ncbi:hypothetical protein B5X24_HaOG211064 [Helicoverpa armigera]|uniref:Uncharacterized protein n=1 Tax=Helicoverpa armigera TaxID=29058 RepID=A0A2W1BIE9_HELAM|nr:hypothetical protein B5X24_HaOG211064 [Helicoverpa armigera]